MFKAVKQIRAAVSLLNPEEVRRTVARAPDIGLVASSPSGYAEMEDFLVPAAVPHGQRLEIMQSIYRAGDRGAPGRFDIVLSEAGLPCPEDAFPFPREDPESAIRQVLHDREELSLALARHYRPFRKPVTDAIIQAVARENALFAVATSLPNIVPSLLELPWAMGEFASDTSFITINQVRMAFLIAAACGGNPGFAEQKAEIASVVAGAFGWRALARELAGKIPLGGGLIPKGAIAYAGTYLMGKGMQRLHHAGRRLTPRERREVYQEGYAKGRAIVEGGANSDS
jgi:hypothetical protein